MALFCSRCGADNPAIARYCGDCGQLLEEADVLETPPPALDATGERPAPCVRCGAALQGEAKCPTCGALQPLGDGLPDPWLHWLAFRIPDLVRSPRLAAAALPWRGDLSGVLPPIVAAMLLIPWGWFVSTAPLLLPAWADTTLPQPEGGGLAAWLAVLVIVGPCLLIGYGGLVQGVFALCGGAAPLEKTIRALGLILLPGWLLIGGWLFLMRVSQLALYKQGWLSADFAIAPIPAVYLYALLPLLCAYAAFFTLIATVLFQAVFLAELHRVNGTVSLWLHGLVLAAIVLAVLLQRPWPFPRPPLTLQELAWTHLTGGWLC